MSPNEETIAKRSFIAIRIAKSMQNVQCNRTGYLWQQRYFSCPVEFASLAEVLAYIELNPVRAGIVERPEDYEWSSARAHLAGLMQQDYWI